MKYIFFAILLVSSCQVDLKKRDLPENLIPQDQMINVVKDMVKLEAFVQSKYPSVSKYYKVMISSGDSLLATHQVTREQYESSMKYYAANQSDLQFIYDQSLEELGKEKVKVETE